MTTDRTDGSDVSLVDRVVTITRERILSGEYEPGARLRLQKLAGEAGVSLIPVREALRILEAERLVVSVANKGSRVADLSVEDMRDLYATRILLETAALRSARPLSGDAAAELRQTLAAMKAAHEAADFDTMLRLHRQFHFGLYAQTTSPWLSYLIDILWNHTERYQRLSIPFRHDGADAEHLRVLRALEKGDNEGAARSLQTHLESTARLVEEAYSIGTVLRTAEK
ncbi:MAG: GntR family transcriptional regulator [Acidobacteria bacterium]|nr:GntR family transcriptional regulator [Acidobacteriota bacterium]